MSENVLHRERVTTRVMISLLTVLMVILLGTVLWLGEEASRQRARGALADEVRQGQLVEQMIRLQECTVQLLLVQPEIRAGLPSEEIDELCPRIAPPGG